MLLGKGLSSSGGRRCRGSAKAFATRFEIPRPVNPLTADRYDRREIFH